MYVIFISSPYLLVFGDDRVRGTREQRMLMQVEQVVLSREWGSYWGNFLYLLYLFLETVVNPDGWNYNIVVLVYGIDVYKLYANI